MKKLFLMFLLLLVSTFGFQNAFAENYRQFNIPQHAITRIGKGLVTDMVYSPDGHRLAVATGIGIWIYDIQTGEEVAALLGHKYRIKSIAYSPDGSTLASASGDGTVRLWDATTGRSKVTIGTQKTLQGVAGIYTGNFFFNVAYSPDGLTLATTSREGVQLWDAVTGSHKATLAERASSRLNTLTFSHDGRTLASANYKDVFLWDVARRTQKTTLKMEARVYDLAFSPIDNTLAIGNFDRIVLWDATTGREHTVEPYSGLSLNTNNVTYSPDGQTLASSNGNSVTIFNPTNGHTASLGEYRYDPSYRSSIQVIRYSPDGHTLATVAPNSIIKLWDIATQKLKAEWSPVGPIFYQAAYSPDGGTLAGLGSEENIYLWDVAGDLKTIIKDVGMDSIRDMAYSPNGRTLALANTDIVRLWDATTGGLKTTIEDLDMSSFGDIVYSPDGRTLAISEGHIPSNVDTNNVRLWDATTGGLKTTIEIPISRGTDISHIAYSPDGRTIAVRTSTSNGGLGRIEGVYLLDAATGNLKTTIELGDSTASSLAYSPDGRTLAIGIPGDLTLWDVVTRVPKGQLQVIGCIFYDLAFSPDGSLLVSGGSDSLLHLWDVATGERKGTLFGHTSGINSVSFSPDGRAIVSASGDGTILLWDVSEFISQRPQEMVQLIHFRPNNRSLRRMDATLNTLIMETQQFFAKQMQSHGHGRKTFTFETDANSNPVVHYMDGQFTDAYYGQQTYEKIRQEISKKFDISKNVYLVVIDASSQTINSGNRDVHGIGGGGWWRAPEALRRTHEGLQRDVGGLAVIPASGPGFSVQVAAHELGHAFGLDHDFRDDTYLMAYGSQQRLSDGAAEWLDACRFFNTAQAFFNQPTTIEMLSKHADRLWFQITDSDRLHQVQLLIPTTADDPVSGEKLHGYKALNGQTGSKVGFVVPELTGVPSVEVRLKVIDVQGYIAELTFQVETDEGIPMDVNGDGVVNVLDMVLVSSNFGQSGQNSTDVNGDGEVNITDLVLVAGALGDGGAAAPALLLSDLEGFTAAEVQNLLMQARQIAHTDPAYLRGITVLEQLLAALTPEETALLPNYPNPFNPETWIPYQLSKPANVIVSIYAADGKLVRTLVLGELPAGIYESRSRAAYWDGKNQLGESVASGVYFYTLSAGDFTATRKMLIRK